MEDFFLYDVFLKHIVENFSETFFRVLGISIAVFFSYFFYSSLKRIYKRFKLFSVDDIKRSKELEELREQVKSFKSDDIGDKSYVNFLQEHINGSAKRYEIQRNIAEERADRLYQLGSFLFVFSVLCPILATLFYWQVEPFPESSMFHIKQLKDSIGELPKDLSFVIARDWRILLGGITFGFLCLAVARGLFAQQSKQNDIARSYQGKADQYYRLISVVDILEREKADCVEPHERKFTSLVVERLLDASLSEDIIEKTEDGHSEKAVDVENVLSEGYRIVRDSVRQKDGL